MQVSVLIVGGEVPGPNAIRVRRLHHRRCRVTSCSFAAVAPLPLLAQLGGDVVGHPASLAMGGRKLVLRHAPTLHPELDSLASRQIKPVLTDEATLIFRIGHERSCWGADTRAWNDLATDQSGWR
jgi:hypothetical protein